MTTLVEAATARSHRLALALAVSLYGGPRQSETLALRWQDCELERGRLRVVAQLGRDGKRAELKTESAAREVVVPPFVVAMLRERKQQQFAAGFARPEDYVFATRTGKPVGQRNLLRDYYEVLADAGLDGADGRLRPRWHDLRHTCASVLIAKGLPVTSVAHQLGHANPSITLKIYAHLFDAAAHEERVAAALESAAQGGKAAENGGGERRRTDNLATASIVAGHPASATAGD
jgi:integrase